jgi:hypothetical protein
VAVELLGITLLVLQEVQVEVVEVQILELVV